ncbi:hypothetical protein ABIE79_010145 [Bradyrhizobium diazoefficiens]
MSKTIVKFLPPEEVGQELSGWWILSIDGDDENAEGSCFDAIGPYDSKEEAERLLANFEQQAQ